ncbi:hypothetical protein [Faecalibacter rhinopitheci]|uniref:Uncharacterized protein n=1 Tax=Faecalibacter rhinopitheci TaxID=2779678 RepID=A0A8J7FR75_9FLAO|nr:hypothetical protein [Faecalibacter rhinopitheci]MBF0598364.1 hypothetical protein [Faecalibacter rhinopitheci]
MKPLILNKVARFVFNTNIREVKNIYKGKVEESMLINLVSDVNELQNKYDNYSRTYLSFILNLDE